MRLLRYALALVALLLVTSGAEAACTNTGGYPFTANGCLNAADLNRALQWNAGAAPPQNALGQGAQYGSLWEDRSVNPYVVRRCIGNPCATTYLTGQWSNVFIVDPTSGNVSLFGHVRRVLTGSTADALRGGDGTVLWLSATPGAKSEALLSCGPTNAGATYLVADGIGTAGTYNIVLAAPGGTTVRGAGNFSLSSNYETDVLQCDGVNNWTVQTVGTAGGGDLTTAGCGLESVGPVISASGIRQLTDADGDVTLLATDNIDVLVGALTAQRTWTLPLASSMLPGCTIKISDAVGGISAAYPLVIATTGTDTINGDAAYPLTDPWDQAYVTAGPGNIWTVTSVVNVPSASGTPGILNYVAKFGADGLVVGGIFDDGTAITNPVEAFHYKLGYGTNSRTVAGTTDTLSTADCGQTITYTSGSPVTVTTVASIVSGSDVCPIALYQSGAGQITIADGAGATHTGFDASAGQGSILSLSVMPDQPSLWIVDGAGAGDLVLNQLVVGGAFGLSTSLGSLGTLTTVLHGNAGGLPSFGPVANADLVNAATTVNGQTCTLGSTCTVTDAAATISTAGIAKLNNAPISIGWMAGINPNGATIAVINQDATISAIVGDVETATGTAATVSVYEAASGTACSAGTVLHSGSLNANGTPATNQTLAVTTPSVTAGMRLCIVTTGTTSWTGGTGVGGVTVFLAPS